MYKKEIVLTFTAKLMVLFMTGPRVQAQDVIPAPVSFTAEKGAFSFGEGTTVYYDSGANAEAEKLAGFLRIPTGFPLPVKQFANEQNGVVLKINRSLNELGDEGYALTATKRRVVIVAPTEAGLFYGTQTLRQLLPVEIESPEAAQGVDWKLPCCTIKDQPRFSWRGMMLDVSRHFFDKEEVKKLLDTMAAYKLNRFHWHLTDTDGWRIEIKKYPKLATVGGIGDRTNPDASARFYTQEDIKEIVKYARLRHIVVVPEIDMPGHAAAANRAYPEYSGGGSKRNPEFTFNPGQEATYAYLEDILEEVCALFPGKWLHLGGDEVHFGWEKWKTDADVKAMMEEEGLESLREMECYFVRRMAGVINKLGKVATGWDEIASAGVPNENSMVMWWRHDKPNLRDKIVKGGYQTVLCPRQPCYFDFVQDTNHTTGRKWDGAATLEKIIAFPKFPKNYTEEDKNRVLGLQCNLWTEKIKTVKRLDFMTFPRLLAIAESGWTDEEKKDIDNFKRRLEAGLPRLGARKIYYFNPFDPESTPEVHE